MAQTELIDFSDEDLEDPVYAVCYGSGKFAKEGAFFRVGVGTRRLVLRTLCVVGHFNACTICPNFDVTLTFERTKL